MAIGRHEVAAGAELIRAATRRLEQAWQREVTVGDVLVAMTDRCAFVTALPGGGPVVVKTDLRPGHTAAERRITVAARAAGVPVPEVILAVDAADDPDDDAGLALLVLAHVPGRPLAADAPASAWAGAGRVLRRLHDMGDPGGLKPWPGRPPDAGVVSGLPLRSALAGHAAREAAGTVKRGLPPSRQLGSAGYSARPSAGPRPAAPRTQVPAACCTATASRTTSCWPTVPGAGSRRRELPGKLQQRAPGPKPRRQASGPKLWQRAPGPGPASRRCSTSATPAPATRSGTWRC